MVFKYIGWVYIFLKVYFIISKTAENAIFFHEDFLIIQVIFYFSLVWNSQRRQWHPTPVLLPGKSHGWRSLVGCSPWGRWESDMTERLHFLFSPSCIGEENGNPLQCSCLENPRDGGAWWAAIYGVAQSRTRLKWLSSSSRQREVFTDIYSGANLKHRFSKGCANLVIASLAVKKYWVKARTK